MLMVEVLLVVSQGKRKPAPESIFVTVAETQLAFLKSFG
jgi:hypothetical protein